MRLAEPRFGTDGVRGVANEELSADLALRLGVAAAHVLGRREPDRRVVVGRDTRLSGDMLEAALTAGLTSMGWEALRVGVVPTPGVSRIAVSAGAAAGIVISASHNPFADNGIKFFGADGHKLSNAVEGEIEEAMGAWETLPRSRPGSIGRSRDEHRLVHDYLRQVRGTAPARLEGLKLVLDCANGATHALAPALFAELGAGVTAIHAEPDGVNINEGCGSTCPADLCARVREDGADAGLAFDGDGDRVMLCDARGEVVDGDRMMAICALAMQRRGELPADVVVATIMSNAGLDVALERHGIRLERTDVGDRYVAEAMERLGAAIGGEQSGHLLLPRLTPTGDGMVTALQVLGEMRRAGKPLADLAAVVEPCPQVLRNVRVRDRGGWERVPAIREAVRRARSRLGRPEWLSVRTSGTEPLVRVMAQDPDAGRVAEVVDGLCALIHQHCGASA